MNFDSSIMKKLLDLSPVHVVLVSLLVDQLSGLFLISFLLTKEKFVQYQIFFVHSLEFFVQSFLKMWFWSVSWPTNCPVNFLFFKKDWTINSREWTKKIWDWTNFFLVHQKKWEIHRTIGRPRDWPKPHGRDLRYQLTGPTYQTSLSRFRARNRGHFR